MIQFLYRLFGVFIVVLAGARVSLSAPIVESDAEKGSYYSLHPPAISVPGGKPGETRRSLMQFHYWTLICDEMRARQQQVCNVTQAVWDKDNNVIFSWSLAATDDGRPFMLLRTTPDIDKNIPVRLDLKGKKRFVNIAFVGCDQTVCLAQTPVGPILTRAIDEGESATISYQTNNKDKIEFETSFIGLKEAVASIQ